MDFLLECLRKGTAPVKVVEFAKKYLNELGFEELYYNTSFEPEEGGRYYMTPFPDVIFAFTMGQKRTYRQKLRMAFAHVDQPCFKVKASPDFENMGAAQLNVEVYGGMMDHTWFDRPLGLSGSVALVGEDPFHPCILSYESDGPVAVIPGLSRSGTTITAGIATGLKREFAVKFSFLLSIPAVLGADACNRTCRRPLDQEDIYPLSCRGA